MSGRTLSSTRSRMIGLLAAVVFAVLTIAAVIVSWATLGEGSAQLARLATGQALAVDALLGDSAAELPAQLRDLGPRVRLGAPVAEQPDTPLGNAVLARAGELLGDRDRVRFEAGSAPYLWFQSAHAPQRWIGVAVEPLRAQVARASLLVLLVAGLAVLAAGTWFARSITRPLEDLAARAPELLAQGIAPETLPQASREVAAMADVLSKSAAQLRVAQRQREEMLAGLSHDLRTPLARLRFALELGDADAPDSRAAMVGDIEEMDELIAQFLALVREGRSEPAARLRLDELVRNVVSGFRHRAAEIELDLAALPEIHGHALALRRALTNLIQNALTHGRPPLHVRLSGASDGAVLLEVRDHGGGLSGPEPTASRGYGIGLAVVHAVAAQHRGSVELTNHLEGGLCVRLTLRGTPTPTSS